MNTALISRRGLQRDVGVDPVTIHRWEHHGYLQRADGYPPYRRALYGPVDLIIARALVAFDGGAISSKGCSPDFSRAQQRRRLRIANAIRRNAESSPPSRYIVLSDRRRALYTDSVLRVVRAAQDTDGRAACCTVIDVERLASWPRDRSESVNPDGARV